MIKTMVWFLIFLSFVEFQPSSNLNDPVYKNENRTCRFYDPDTIIFNTAIPSPLAIVGDLQQTSFLETLIKREQNDFERKEIVQAIVKENPAGLILLGDAVFNGSDKNDWKFFDELFQPIKKANIPIYPVLGNHEYWGRNSNALNNAYIRFPILNPAASGQHWYSEIFGALALIFLDSNKDEMSDEDWDNQKEWFESAVNYFNADPEVKGILIFLHHPPYTNSTVTGDEYEIQKAFLNTFNNSTKTLAMVSGHAHTYERFCINNKMFIVSGGGGGPRVTLNRGKNCHPDLCTIPSPRPFNYLLLNQNEDGIIITVKGVDKGCTDFYTIEEFALNFISSSLVNLKESRLH